MTDDRSIAVSGDLGSGKSTVSALLADRLGIERVSMGDLHRAIASARGVSAYQLNVQSERDESIDDQIDGLQAEMAKSGRRLVIDSRLGWHFFADAFKIHLIVDPLVGADRVMARPATAVEKYSDRTEAAAALRARSDSERTRFLRRYGVDKARLRNYDLVCDTSRATPEDIADAVLAVLDGDFARFQGDSSVLLFLDPARTYPGPAERAPAGDSADQPSPGHRGAGPGPDVGAAGFRHIAPISVAYTGALFYVLSGQRRLSAALRRHFSLIPALLAGEGAEEVLPGRTAEQLFRSEVTPAVIADWEAVHGITLPPPGLELAALE
jgi:CMP/dCMP kinase